MAQSGYTPLLIYGSGTTGNTPSSSNLTNSTLGSELAINYYDGKLFYKDNGGTVQVIASKAATGGTFSTVAITGGTIDNTSIGTTTPSSVKLTSLTFNSTTAPAGLPLGAIPFGDSGGVIRTSNYLSYTNDLNVGSTGLNYLSPYAPNGNGLSLNLGTLYSGNLTGSFALQLMHNLYYPVGGSGYKYQSTGRAFLMDWNAGLGYLTFNFYPSGTAGSSLGTVVQPLIFNSSGAWSPGGYSSFGTAGQVLTSSGSSGIPTWTTPTTGVVTTPFNQYGVAYANSTSTLVTTTGGSSAIIGGFFATNSSITLPTNYGTSTGSFYPFVTTRGSSVYGDSNDDSVFLASGLYYNSGIAGFAYVGGSGTQAYRLGIDRTNQALYFVAGQNSGSAGSAVTLSYKFAVAYNGAVGVSQGSGAISYGTSGQHLISGGSSTYPAWTSAVPLPTITTSGSAAVSNLRPLGTLTIANSTSYSFVCSAGLQIFYISWGTDGGLYVANYSSATISSIGPTPTNIVLSNSPTSSQLGVYKSSSSNTINIVTGNAFNIVSSTISITLISGLAS
jgi:hypothetical protein